MDPVFVVEQLMTPEEYLYIAKHPCGKSAVQKRRLGWQSSLLLGGMSAAFALYGYLENIDALAVPAALLIAFLLFKHLLLENWVLRRQYNFVLSDSPGATPKCVYSFYPDWFAIYDGRDKTKYKYAELCDVTEDKRYILLWLNDELVLRVPKTNFSGSESLKKFLLEKTASNQVSTP